MPNKDRTGPQGKGPRTGRLGGNNQAVGNRQRKNRNQRVGICRRIYNLFLKHIIK